MASSKQTQQGTLSPAVLHILIALADSDLHGYGIKLDVEARTDGAMSLGSGTLYEAIQRLETIGYIAETTPPADAPSGARKRRYYRLEQPGRSALENELARMDKIVRFARHKKLMPKAHGS
jgi:DNA-binding PadR family transcriptional regulator